MIKKQLFWILTTLLLSISSFGLAETSQKNQPTFEIATFAGGCFWCTEADLEKAPGVVTAISGFAGGNVKNPTYEQVSGGGTGHIEVVQVTYDPALIKYTELLEYFWRNIDPTDGEGQFVDRGAQYRPAIFFHNQQQKIQAQAGLDILAKKFDKPIKVELIKYTAFYPAEEYHQDYYKKSTLKYKYYRLRSGRDDFIEKHWDSAPAHSEKFKKPSKEQLKNQLSKIEYGVTQDDDTEEPFKNPYWDNKKQGIYVDIVSKEPLFSSTDKFKSGTGWPSFTRPIHANALKEQRDFSLILPRMEVRSILADSHLGHVFEDGPAPTGLRYCVNSAALKFIAKEDLEKEGYGHYLSLFKE